ncbi:unnamed protein product [Rhizoctonia solani]|uniref:Zn(2)-C6 fungal-type domain-containing protein n=1 Tax=Rhizoctonia solani TaxID=456999 RepID=A0A8H3B8H2_9AGAM|nr:unnamed protein product [Rhizoctonia solani]
MTSTRSNTGCFACKSKHKKCDETKPHCLRCQKSRIECPGYTYIQDPNKPNRKPRTLPAPRTRAIKSHTTPYQGTTQEPSLLPQRQLPLDDLAPSEASYSVPASSEVASVGTPSRTTDTSNWPALSCSFSGSLGHPSVDFSTSHRLAVNPANPYSTTPPLGASTTTPLTYGQASLLAALFSLGQPPDMDLSSQHIQPSIHWLPDPSTSSVSSSSPPNIDQQDDITTHEDEDPEGVVSVIYRELVLDKTAQSNALPFVLQAYAAWTTHMALEPSKMMGVARDFVFSHFEDGEQSRWIVALLANVGIWMGSGELVEARPNPMFSALGTAVLKQLGAVKSLFYPKRPELVTVLNFALETLVMHFYISPLVEVVIIRQEAAPIFRLLCQAMPNAPINLPSLLVHPLSCLRHYVHTDILFNLVIDMPTLFRYEVAIPSNQPFNCQIASEIQGDGILQWRHGMPNNLILLFARMILVRSDECPPSGETIASLERNIRELQPFDGSCSDPFLFLMRFVIQECWRQVAYVYLYMAVCGDTSDTSRVKENFKRFIQLLKGIKSGRMPDTFLMLPLLVISPAAQRQPDREVIRQRTLGIHKRGQVFRANNDIARVIEDYWARADAEGRPIMWSDIAVSRRRVLGA